MSSRILRRRLTDSTNIWPGFVDVLATLLIVIIFVLMVFTVSQIYLSDAISGRDKALENLRNQINELSKILLIESKEKQEIISKLEGTESDLMTQKDISSNLKTELGEKEVLISEQNQNILILSSQIEDLLNELKIVAKALETYEGQEIQPLEIQGLGERINKALATRIDQLNELNNELEATNQALKISKNETANQLKLVEQLNQKLSENEEQLQNQIQEYQKLTKDLLAINESLGLEDANLIDQLEAIKSKDAALIEQLEKIKVKNQELALLNENLIQKDNTIIDLRDKILELNNILSIEEELKFSKENKITNLNKTIQLLEKQKNELEKRSELIVAESEKERFEILEEVEILSNEINMLKKEINILNEALEASEQNVLTKELKIEVLGERLNKALTSKVFELQKYRSEFFGRLQTILGERSDIKVVGDRFIFESELLFDSGSASLQNEGKEKLKEVGITLKEITSKIPNDIDWIIQVEGHTDKNPINTILFPSNWELSSARANSVLKLLLELGFDPQRLSAAGYGEFRPITIGESEEFFRQNRRIELKLTAR